MTPTMEVVQLGIGPSMCCARCKQIMKPGEKVRTWTREVIFRGLRHQRKSNGSTDFSLMVHEACWMELERERSFAYSK